MVDSNDSSKFKELIEDTQDNLHEARQYYKVHEDVMSMEAKKDVKRKNERREQAIKGFEKKIKHME